MIRITFFYCLLSVWHLHSLCFFLFLESRNFMEWCILCMRLLPWSWFQRHTTSCLCVLPRLCGAVHEHNHVMDHIADWEDTLIQVAAERFCHSETEWCISGIWCPHQELCRNCILQYKWRIFCNPLETHINWKWEELNFGPKFWVFHGIVCPAKYMQFPALLFLAHWIHEEVYIRRENSVSFYVELAETCLFLNPSFPLPCPSMLS
jgi:hypothetical protein